MSKILISFLGTGPENKEYKKANYSLDNKIYKEYSFIASALHQHFSIEKIIVLGTMKSMWEELYHYFSKQVNKFNEEIYDQLFEMRLRSDNNSELDETVIKRISEQIKFIQCRLLRYGINDEELNFNMQQILKLETYLQEGDEIYIDITHSFRSIPIYILPVLFYLQDVSKKNLVIKGIYYGMLDISAEMNGVTPVVNLKPVLEMQQWIKGAYAFQEFGKGELITSLLKDNIHQDIVNKVDNLSKALSINYFYNIKQMVSSIEKLKLDSLDTLSSIVVSKVMEDFTLHFSESRSDGDYQLALAEWHYSNYNFSSAFIILAEAIITSVGEMEGVADLNNKEQRESVRNKSLFKKLRYKELRKHYQSINNIRKNVAHGLQSRKDMMLNDITTLPNLIKKVKAEIEKLKLK